MVFHLVGAQRTDEYCHILCDLRFVEARCRLGQVFELIADYQMVDHLLPERQAELGENRQQRSCVGQYVRDIIDYARAWSNWPDGKIHPDDVAEPRVLLPSPPASHLLSGSGPQTASESHADLPSRRTGLGTFADFALSQAYLLGSFGAHHEAGADREQLKSGDQARQY